ncbi:MAG: hypothetical protein SGPRY_014431, partial [Prymnesium sp.]
MSSLPQELGGRKGGISTNKGIPRSQKGISVMPRAQEYARAQAVCARAGMGGSLEAPYAGVYGVDKNAAYCFGPVQRADHYAGCYLWVDEADRVKPHVSLRMVFGGASWPNRFERISLLDSAWVTAEGAQGGDEQHSCKRRNRTPGSVENGDQGGV